MFFSFTNQMYFLFSLAMYFSPHNTIFSSLHFPHSSLLSQYYSCQKKWLHHVSVALVFVQQAFSEETLASSITALLPLTLLQVLPQLFHLNDGVCNFWFFYIYIYKIPIIHKHTNLRTFLTIFQRFPATFRRFSKCCPKAL